MMITTKRRLLDQTELNDHERKNLQILDTVRKKGPIARAEISRLIGLNIVTVASYVDQFIKKGVVKEVGIDVSSGGRKPTLVDLNPSNIFLIGVGLNVVQMIAVLCNLKGDIIASVKRDRSLEAGEAVVHRMVEIVDDLIRESKVDTGKVHGIGIGIPGIFNRDTNSVRWPVGLLNDGDLSITVSIHAIFEEKFGIPTFVDNDANAAVFGEDWYGKGLGVQHAIYLYSGNGCGFLINGQIYRGSNGCAGEWLFQEEDNALQVLKESYKTGTWGLDLGIAIRAQMLQKENPTSKIYELSKKEGKPVTMLTVVKASESGDELAIKLLREAGQQLGRKAAFLVNLINPEIIVVGGGIEAAGVPFLDALKDTIKKAAIPEATEKLRIAPSMLGENGVPLGAAALVAQSYFVSC